MLLSCPECSGNVSSKAPLCPHCGYPMNTRSTAYKPKRMKLPNGFGQISKLKSTHLRNPYRAMVTVGKTEFGRPICKLLKPKAYFATYNEAYEALMEYHKNPFDIRSDMTVLELYNKWFEEYKESKSEGRLKTIRGAWKYCSMLYDLPVNQLKPMHIKNIMTNGSVEVMGNVQHPSANTQLNIKTIFTQMLDYAIEYDIIDKNYGKMVRISEKTRKEKVNPVKQHLSFTDNEISILWEHADDPIVQMILIQCYSGWRPSELCELRISDIDLAGGTFKGGMKTDAGRDRVVPIHSKVLPFVERFYDPGHEYLFMHKVEGALDKYNYHAYYHQFRRRMKQYGLNPEHRAHDPRKYFITTAKKYKVDEYAIKYIVGHSITDLTERVYTERDINWLRMEMEKIKVDVGMV